ncbi:hypothetical protein SDC9_200149 [bioreactor metagenome]|uniref:Uncharacterized protein n=1 Tax=bioreactor metagenome TaxID=1076179 RepID=A0A645IMJ9_9ZZZZ
MIELRYLNVGADTLLHHLRNDNRMKFWKNESHLVILGFFDNIEQLIVCQMRLSEQVSLKNKTFLKSKVFQEWSTAFVSDVLN